MRKIIAVLAVAMLGVVAVLAFTVAEQKAEIRALRRTMERLDDTQDRLPHLIRAHEERMKLWICEQFAGMK